MNPIELIKGLWEKGVELNCKDGSLCYRGNKDIITKDIIELLKKHKDEILQILNRKEDINFYPLSYGQKALWFINHFAPESSSYNVGASMLIEGNLDIEKLQLAFKKLVLRHEVLRTVFFFGDSEPLQKILTDQDVPFKIVDALNFNNHEIYNLALDFVNLPFNLESGPLMRVRLFQVKRESYFLVIALHHIIYDYFSEPLFFHDLFFFYYKNVTDSAIELPKVQLRYTDYILWQNNFVNSTEGKMALKYWVTKLDNFINLKLPNDKERPLIQSNNGKTINFEIEKELYKNVKNCAKDNNATIYMVVLATFFILIHRYTNQDDIIIGGTVSGRRDINFYQILGYFMNPIILRTRFNKHMNVLDLIESLKLEVTEVLTNQDYPFSLIVEKIGLKRDSSRSPIFQVMFNFLPKRNFSIVENYSDKLPISKNKLKILPLPIAEEEGQFDLMMNIRENDDSLSCNFKYNVDLFFESSVERFKQSYLSILDQITKSITIRISDISYFEDKMLEYEDIDFPEYKEHNLCLHKLFEDQVLRTPNNYAVEHAQNRATYQQLNDDSNRIAKYLIETGLKINDIVCIFLERSIELVASILAVLKAGGAFLPLDIQFPKQRIDFIIKDSKSKFLITTKKNAVGLPETDCHVIIIDSIEFNSSSISPENIVLNQDSDSLAYVIYTSGSTGKPKGVLIEHRSIVNFSKWAVKRYDLKSNDRVLQFASISFDTALEEIFPCLLSGGSLVLRTDTMLLNTIRFWNSIKTLEITVLDLPTAYFTQLILEMNKEFDIPTALRLIIIGGERVKTTTINNWLNNVGEYPQLINTYGPTEATIVTTSYRISKAEMIDKKNVPIGIPIDNADVFVMDKYMKRAPIGVTGELCIGGVGLARGYLNRSELETSVFITKNIETGKKIRLYRTGDLCKISEEGNILYVGRKDRQIKVNGYRVELEEIERVLMLHPNISKAVVCLREQAVQPRLVAFIVKNRNNNFDIEKIKLHLFEKMPHYMVPGQIFVIDDIPLNIHGKIDYKTLLLKYNEEIVVSERIPKTDIEIKLADIWKSILKHDRISVNDNFFDIGGNSISIVIVHNIIKETICDNIKVTDLFAYPTIEMLAKYIIRISPIEVSERPLSINDRIYNNEPIAIIGMACRFPKIANTKDFWDVLINGSQVIRKFTADELLSEGFDRNILNIPNYVQSNALIENLELFDANFFNFSPRDAERLDPQIRVFLECSYHALEAAGYVGKENQNIGVFSACGINRYLIENIAVNGFSFHENDSYSSFEGKDFLSTIVSYKLKIRGPSMNIQTACSSSLVAIHQACKSLIQNECDIALAGGVSLSCTRKVGYIYQKGGILSSDGRCRAFDKDASGTVPGSGAGVVVLKKLSAAIADRDNIDSIILGSAINNDGSNKVGFTAPSVAGQTEVVKKAIIGAGINANDIGYIEAHGTGTRLGDPIEISALTKAFRYNTTKTNFCAIGSVKTNLGHTDAAAGVTSVIKATLMLKNNAIPASLNFTSPNPEIDFANSPFYIANSLKTWSNDDKPKIAGVHSFGIGGTNAHLILKEVETINNVDNFDEDPYQIINFSAKSTTSLKNLLININQYIIKENPNIRDMAYTINCKRPSYSYRKSIIVKDCSDAINQIQPLIEQNSFETTKPELLYIAFNLSVIKNNFINDDCFNLPTVEKYSLNIFKAIKSIVDRNNNPYNSDIDLEEIYKSLPQKIQIIVKTFIIEYCFGRSFVDSIPQIDGFIGIGFGKLCAAIFSGLISLECALIILLKSILSPSYFPHDSNSPLSLLYSAIIDIDIQNFSVDLPTIPFFCSQSNCWITNKSQSDVLTTKLFNIDQDHSFSLENILRNQNTALIELPVFILHSNIDHFNGLIKKLSERREINGFFRSFLMEFKKYFILGILWESGININWDHFYDSNKMKSLSLPSYPFDRKRYWIRNTSKIENIASVLQDSKNLAIKEETGLLYDNPDTSFNFVEPQNQYESVLLRGFQNILGIKQIGTTDNYFEMGGDSLSAINLITYIENEFDLEISINDIFEYPTIQSLSDLLLSKEFSKLKLSL